MINSVLGIKIDIAEKLGIGDTGPFRFVTVEDVGPLISKILGNIIVIAAIMLLFYLILSGIQWLTSGGEKTAVAAARERMTAAFIGLLIILSAWAIFTLIRYMFGIPPVPERGPYVSPCASYQYDCCRLTNQTECCRTPGKTIIGPQCTGHPQDCIDQFSCQLP